MSSAKKPIDLTSQEEEMICSICFDSIKKNKATLDSCMHCYHYNCIKVWSSVKNTCPLCKRKFHKITPPNKKAVKIKNTHRIYGRVNMEQFLNETLCQICKDGNNEIQMLLCNDCDKGHHIFCLSPPLDSIPRTNWYCEKCKEKRKKARRRAQRNRGWNRQQNPQQINHQLPDVQPLNNLPDIQIPDLEIIENNDDSQSEEQYEDHPDIMDSHFFGPILRMMGAFPASYRSNYRQNYHAIGQNELYADYLADIGAPMRSYNRNLNWYPDPNRAPPPVPRRRPALTAEQRDRIKLNHFHAVCRLQRNRLMRILSFRSPNVRLPPIPQVSTNGSLNLQQQIQIQKNYLNALEIRMRRLTASFNSSQRR